MTAIQQSPVANRHSIDDRGQHSGQNNGAGVEHDNDAMDNSTGNPGSSTVNISFQATMRLRAYQEQKTLSSNQQGTDPANSVSGTLEHPDNNVPLRNTVALSITETEQQSDGTVNDLTESDVLTNRPFPISIDRMLSEVQDNLVQRNEPGYRHLLNLLENNGAAIEDNQQLQEIMRREQFYLGRRRPFMNNSDFQSYSQVLNQFSNIVERQQYAY